MSATSAPSAREYSHKLTQSICEDPNKYLADHADNRRRNPNNYINYKIRKSKHLFAFSTQLFALTFNMRAMLCVHVYNVVADNCKY